MTRTLAGSVALRLLAFAHSSKYPTRSVEHTCAWLMIVWSASLLPATPMLVGVWYKPMLEIMPELAWGLTGVTVGVLRIAALIGNGHWRPSPELRTIGAVWGMMFWIALSYCYWEAITAGAPDFPFRRAFYVLIISEAYSCLRCGQDIAGQREKFKAMAQGAGRSGLTGHAGYG